MLNTTMTRLAQALALTAALGSSAMSQAAPISLTATGTAYTQDFDTLASTGTSSTLPLGWEIAESGSNANTIFTAGTGSSTAGDTYSFGNAGTTDRALGGLRSGTLTPVFGVGFTNMTGSALTSLLIAYTGEQWRLGTTGRADRLDFEYSLNATAVNTGTWTPFDALDFSSPTTTGTAGLQNGNAAANRLALSSTLANLSIANGASFWLRWTDLEATGPDDGLAVDDFSLTATGTTPGGDMPEPTSLALVGAALLGLGLARRRAAR